MPEKRPKKAWGKPQPNAKVDMVAIFGNPRDLYLRPGEVRMRVITEYSLNSSASIPLPLWIVPLKAIYLF